MLHFVKTSDPAAAAEALARRLQEELAAGRRVLWLVPGGSNIPLSVKIMESLPKETQTSLAIMLTDERFGPEDHKDSNTRQLREAGFQPGQATVVPVLLPGEQSLQDTCERYAQAIQTAFEHADIIIGQFGMGADGHIAGMLPGSSAVTSDKLVDGYDAGNFIRITLTPKAITQLHVAYLFAFGEGKLQALTNLQDKDLPLLLQPAQILKQLPEAYVYNDQVGEQA